MPRKQTVYIKTLSPLPKELEYSFSKEIQTTLNHQARDSEYMLVSPIWSKLNLEMTHSQKSKSKYQSHVFFSGDLFYHNYDISIQNIEQKNRFFYVRASKQYNHSSSWKPKKYDFFDIFNEGIPNIVNGWYTKGFSLTNSREDLLSVRTLRGQINNDWKARLYINNFFISEVREENGRYVFQDIQMPPGYNIIKIIKIGPFGEIIEENNYIDSKAQYYNKHFVNYWLNFSENKDKQLKLKKLFLNRLFLDYIFSSKNSHDFHLGQIILPISKTTELNFSHAFGSNTDKSSTVAITNRQEKILFTYQQIFMDLSKENEVFQRPEELEQTLSFNYEWSALQNLRIRQSLERQDRIQRKDINLLSEFVINNNPFIITQSLTNNLNTNNAPQLNSELLIFDRFSSSRLNLFYSTRKIDSLSVSHEVQFNDKISGSISATHRLESEDTDLGLSLSNNFEKMTISNRLSYSDKDQLAYNIAITFPLFISNQRVMPIPTQASGQMHEMIFFWDKNNNDTYEDGEELIEGVVVHNLTTRKKYTSNQNGKIEIFPDQNSTQEYTMSQHIENAPFLSGQNNHFKMGWKNKKYEKIYVPLKYNGRISLMTDSPEMIKRIEIQGPSGNFKITKVSFFNHLDQLESGRYTIDVLYENGESKRSLLTLDEKEYIQNHYL